MQISIQIESDVSYHGYVVSKHINSELKHLAFNQWEIRATLIMLKSLKLHKGL